MNTGEYYNAQNEDSERIAKKKRIRRIDLTFNWLFFVLLSFTSFWILLEDINTYQSEKLYYRLLHDGVSIADYETTDPYMAKGMQRNIQYKDVSPSAFFFAKWKWRVPVYLLLMFLPIAITGLRAWKYHRIRMNWAYFPLLILGFGYAIYFWGRMRAMW